MFDIEGAFDHTSHPLLLTSLLNKRCPPYLLKLLASFLSDRKASFHLQGKSLTVPISMGCPQGSILSPLLWNIYVDGIFHIPLPGNMRIYGYADGIAIAQTSASLPSIHP